MSKCSCGVWNTGNAKYCRNCGKPLSQNQPYINTVETPIYVIAAPRLGTVLELRVKVGDTVKKGDIVLVYEALKMELDLACDKAGVVKRILVGEGDQMYYRQALIELACVGESIAPASYNSPQRQSSPQKIQDTDTDNNSSWWWLIAWLLAFGSLGVLMGALGF